MPNVSRKTPQSITGSTIDDIRRSCEHALRALYSDLNEVIDAVNKYGSGEQEREGGKIGQVRLVQRKTNTTPETKYYLEGKFADGWARLETSFELIGKK